MKRYEILSVFEELAERGYDVECEDGRYTIKGARGEIKFDKFDGRRDKLAFSTSDGKAGEINTKKAEMLDIVILIVSAVGASQI